MGFDGSTVDDKIRSLIEDYHLGNILLTAKNLKCKSYHLLNPHRSAYRDSELRKPAAEAASKLVLELQTMAKNAGHPVPLTIAVDQENGGVNSLFDEIYIRQFPSAMGIAATGSKHLAREVANATAQEMKAVGVNWIMGPVLDVLTNARNQPLGVRTSGDDPKEVSEYGVEFLKGYQKAGLVTCGKHFPSYGNLEFLGSETEVPVITESLEQLSVNAMVPFRTAIAHGLDAMMVGGVAMSSAGCNVMHACLSEQVVDGLLRKDLKFGGVVVSECLEMEALTHNIGVGGGTVMAMKAGCDIVLICRSFPVQQEAINGLKLGVENGMISRARIEQSVRRVLAMKARCTTWEQALNPGGTSALTMMQPSHTTLSTKAYSHSITVVRDRDNLLPLINIIEPDEELLLLTPLLKPLPASAVSRSFTENMNSSPESLGWEKSASVSIGESVFKEFGRSLARQRSGRVLHTSYTSNGVRPVHESLVDRASAVIVVTADANRNIYQAGFTKHISLICQSKFSESGERRQKPLIVIAVSSPYDFATEPSVGTYICTYDFTDTALQAVVRVLHGESSPKGILPGTANKSQKTQQSRQHWLVEAFNEDRDSEALDTLLDVVREDGTQGQRSELFGVTSNSFLLRSEDVDEAHFVVRNSSTHAIYGFGATYFFRSTATGVIGALIVEPSRRKLSIGHSLHNRAIRTLLQRKSIRRFQLGSRLPSIYLGIPAGNPVERKRLRQWLANLGWNTALSRPVCSLILRNLSTWSPPEGLAKSLHTTEVDYDLVYGWDYAEAILDHVKTNSRQGVMEIYKAAIQGAPHSGIIRAKRVEDGAILGSLVIYTADSSLAEHVPVLKATRSVVAGGISSPVISPSVGEYAILMQGLILLGIKQIKKQGGDAIVLDCVRLLFFIFIFIIFWMEFFHPIYCCNSC